jgi:AraC-like DNA-binding protein
MLFTNIIIFINTLILCFVFFLRKNNALPNRILALIIFIPSLNFLNNALILSGAIHQVAYLSFVIQIITPAIPVLIYIYVQLFLGKKIRINTFLSILSGLLFVFILTITLNFALMDDASQRNYMYSLVSNKYPVDLFIYTALFYTVLIAYLVVIGFQVYKHKKSVDQSLSNYDPIHLTYIIRFVQILFIVSAILLVFYLTLPMYYVDYLLLPVTVSVVYFFIFYFSFHYNAVFTKYSFNRFYAEGKMIQEELIPEVTLLQNLIVKHEKHDKIIALFKQAIENEKIFINPELTLKSLSEKFDYPSYLVSQAINLHYHKSFFDVINESRIKEAQQRLKNLSSTHTIESVAFEVGFNSRASFYRAYKKFTGETPKLLT